MSGIWISFFDRFEFFVEFLEMEGNKSQWVKLLVNHFHLFKVYSMCRWVGHSNFFWRFSISLQETWILTVKWRGAIHVSFSFGVLVDEMLTKSLISFGLHLSITFLAIAIFKIIALFTFIRITALIVVSKLQSFHFTCTSSKVPLLSFLSISEHFNISFKFTISFNGFKQMIQWFFKKTKYFLIKVCFCCDLVQLTCFQILHQATHFETASVHFFLFIN